MTSESGRIRDLTILKVDESGDSLWCRTYGEAWDGLFDGIITDDDEYVLLGITTGGRRWRDGYITLIKVDSDGELIFNVDFGCNESDYLARSICDAGDGFIMAGSIGTRIPDQSFDGLVIRTDYNGDTLWIRTYRSPIALIESFKDISPTTDGGFIICGQIETVHDGGRDLPWFVRIDENGEVLWQRYYDWDWQNFYFRLHSIIEYPEGNYLCAGTCTRNLGNNEQRLYNAFLMSIDAEGDSLSSFIVDYRVNPNWCDLHLTQDSSLMAIISPSNSRTTVRKLSFDENSVQRLSGFFPYEFHLFPAYPNPFNTTTILTFNLPHPGAIDLTVFDPLGRQVRKQSQPRWFTNGQHRIVFDGGNMAAGNYMLRLEFGGEVFTQPLILIK